MLEGVKNKIIKVVALIVLTIISSNDIFAQGAPPPPPPGGVIGATQIGVPLDNTDAIYFLIGAGVLYLMYHYRHLLIKKEEATSK
jgi:hypothetical protein